MPNISINSSENSQQVKAAADNGILDSGFTKTTAVAFSPDGKLLAGVGSRGVGESTLIKIWAFGSRKLLRTIDSGSIRSASALKFSSDGKILAVGTDRVYLFSTATGKKLHELKLNAKIVYEIAFAPDGKSVYVSADSKITTWNINDGKKSKGTGRFTLGETYAMAFHNGRFAYCSKEAPINAPAHKMYCVRLDGELLIEFTLKSTLRTHFGKSYALAFSPDGNSLAAIGPNQQLIQWGIPKCDVIGRTFVRFDDNAIVAISPGITHVATSSKRTQIQIVSVETGRKLEPLKGHTKQIECLAFSPDGKTLASGSRDGSIRLWNIP